MMMMHLKPVFLQVQMSVLVEHVEHATNMKCSTISEVSLSKAKHNVHNDQNHDNYNLHYISLSPSVPASQLSTAGCKPMTTDDNSLLIT